MKRFNWRHIPDELHQAIKVRAAKEQVTMEALIEKALKEYLKKQEETK